MRRLRVLPLVLAALLAAPAPAAQAQAPTQRGATTSTATNSAAIQRPAQGDVSVSTSGGFARIILAFNEPTPAEVRVSSGVLVVAFKRPIEVDVNALSTQLSAYVSAVRRDPDGTSLRFALVQRVAANAMEAGERIFIDLMPDSWRGPPPGLPSEIVEELTRRAREAERRARVLETQRLARALPPVTVRVGNHPTFSRFVFGLPEQVGVGLERSGDRLLVRFARPFGVDLRQARGNLPPFVVDIQGETAADELVVRLVLPAHADVRGFREDSTYVVDVTARGTQANPGRQTSISAGEPSTFLPGAQSVNPAPTPAPPAAAPTPAPPAAAPRAAAPAAAQPPAAREPAARPPNAPRAQASPPAAPPAVATGAATSGPEAEPRPPPQAAAPTPGIEAATRETPAPAAPPTASNASPGPARSAGPVAVQVRRAGDTVRILLPFKMNAAGAVFQRADTLWLVFDTTEAVDLSGLQSEASGLFTSVDAARSQNGLSVRLGLDRQRHASTERDGAAWIISLSDAQLEPPRPVTVARERGPEGRSLASVEFAQPGQVHRLADPLAGDTLIVVTGQHPARSFVRQQDFVEFVALAGSHGLVLQPVADDLEVTTSPEGVQIGRPQGLQLSAPRASSGEPVRVARRARTASFDPQVWELDRRAPYREREQDLIAAAAAQHETQRSAPRLELARFYMARGYWAEAKGVVDTIMNQDKRLAEDGSMHALRAIASAMMGRGADVVKDLGHPSLAAGGEHMLWRAVGLVQQGRRREAHDLFLTTTVDATKVWPAPLARKVLESAFDAALEAGSPAIAAERLREYEETAPPESEEPALLLMRGRLAEAIDRPAQAIAAYSGAASGANAVVKADADARLIGVRLAQKQIAPRAAIEQLESMSWHWRGDETEARVLAMLGRLYADQNRFRDAFTALRVAQKHHPRTEATRGLQEALARVFEDLFLEGRTEGMNPVETLALYYDFREMTPPGRRGDDMIRRLADRLVSMDLLDQAAALLQHQIERRLTGAARAQVAARLAVVQIMNRKPAAALNALRTTRQAELPNELRNQRYLLEARALADSGRPEPALALLAEVKSAEADIARADILWSAERFRESAEASEAWAASRRAAGIFGEEERRHILRAAIGYALGNEPLGLDRLRGAWREALAPTPDARAFDIVTAPIEARGVEYREIAKSIADIDTLQAFLKAYRERYPTETPGAQSSLAPRPRG